MRPDMKDPGPLLFDKCNGSAKVRALLRNFKSQVSTTRMLNLKKTVATGENDNNDDDYCQVPRDTLLDDKCECLSKSALLLYGRNVN